MRLEVMCGANSRYLLLSLSLFLFAGDLELSKVENKNFVLQRFWIPRTPVLKACRSADESPKLYKMIYH